MKQNPFAALLAQSSLLYPHRYLLHCPPRQCCSWCCRTPRRCSGCPGSDWARGEPSGSARAGLTNEGSPAGTGIRWTGPQREAPTDPACTWTGREGGDTWSEEPDHDPRNYITRWYLLLVIDNFGTLCMQISLPFNICYRKMSPLPWVYVELLAGAHQVVELIKIKDWGKCQGFIQIPLLKMTSAFTFSI